MHSKAVLMLFCRSKSVGDLGQRSLVSCLSTSFSSETTEQILYKVHTQPPGKGGKKVYIFGPDHMTNMATMPICCKNLKRSFYMPIFVTGYQYDGP